MLGNVNAADKTMELDLDSPVNTAIGHGQGIGTIGGNGNQSFPADLSPNRRRGQTLRDYLCKNDPIIKDLEINL